MFGFNFEFGNVVTYVLEIKQGNNVQTQKISMPQEIATMQSIQLVQEVMNNQTPIRCRFMKEENIYNQNGDFLKKITNCIQFANKSYMEAFKEEFVEE